MVLDPKDVVPANVTIESFQHPKHGYLDFDPRTNIIKQPQQRKPIVWPIGVPERFVGTKQPHIPTCSYPSEGNKGCPKAHECPILRALGQERPHIGPLLAIMQDRDAISAAECYDYFTVHDERGKTIYQINHYENGWKLATDRTTIPIRSANPQFNAAGVKTHNMPVTWEKEVPDLLPYWWPLMKKKGLPLPESAKRFPELVGDDECGSPQSSPSVSQDGAKKPTRKARGGRSGTGSRKHRSAPQSSGARGPLA